MKLRMLYRNKALSAPAFFHFSKNIFGPKIIPQFSTAKNLEWAIVHPRFPSCHGATVENKLLVEFRQQNTMIVDR